MASTAAVATALRGVYFLQPLAIEAPGLLVECAVSEGRFEVRSADGIEAATVHCSGAAAKGGDLQRIDLAVLRVPSFATDVGALYDGFDAVGLQYGPGYRTLMHVWGASSSAFARLHARSTHEGTTVHPADLDDALCLSAIIASGASGETRLPFAVDDALLDGGSREQWAVRGCCHRLDARASTDPLCALVFTGCGSARSGLGLGATQPRRHAVASAA